jgi:hypothetical protein
MRTINHILPPSVCVCVCIFLSVRVPLWANFFCLPTSPRSLQTAILVGLQWHWVFCSSTLGSDLPWDMISFDMQVEENLIPLLQDRNIKMQVRPFFRLHNFCIFLLWEIIAKTLETRLSRLFSPHFVRTMCINMCGVECLDREKGVDFRFGRRFVTPLIEFQSSKNYFCLLNQSHL